FFHFSSLDQSPTSYFYTLSLHDALPIYFFAAKRAPVRLNQYGGTLGGPIVKDKTHFFATWEQTRQLTSFDTTSTVPTLLERQGKDRKSTRLNSSHVAISYAVFCLKKKIK